VFGTPGYASPEQSQEKGLIDHRTDQFAVSVVLYQMITGEIPYERLRWVNGNYTVDAELATAKSKNPGCTHGRLDAVVARGLSFDRNSRFPTTSAWIAALEQAG